MRRPTGPWWTLLDTLTAARKEQTRKGASIANQIGASRNAVGTWESGGVVPNARNFVAWADALGYDVTLVRREES